MKIGENSGHLISNMIEKYGLLGVFALVLSIFSIIGGLIIIVYFVLKIGLFYSIANNPLEIDLEATGITGDFIGGVVGSVWSLSGILLFVLALRLQSKELGMQIEEMKETKSVFQLQQFETTFFSLLKIQHDIANALEINSSYVFFSSNYIRLRNLYDRIYKIVKEEIDIEDQRESQYIIDYQTANDNISFAVAAYNELYRLRHKELGNYFRHLYHILKFVEDNEKRELQELIKGNNDTDVEIKILNKKYKRYADLVQAHMNSSQLALLFYNGICFKKMKRLLHKYDFLENLNKEDLINFEHASFYSSETINGEILPEIHFKERSTIFFKHMQEKNKN